MLKYKFPNIHFLENFWKIFSGIPACCFCVLSSQLDGFDQSHTSAENSLHYFFHCSLSSHHCQHGIIFKDHTLLSWHVGTSKHDIYISSPVTILDMLRTPSFSNLRVSLLNLTHSSFWFSVRLWGTQWQTIFSCVIFHG